MTATTQGCVYCPQSQVLVWQNKRRCLSCGNWLENSQDFSTYYPVTRVLHKLLMHGFTGKDGRIVDNVVNTKQRTVSQKQLEFQYSGPRHNALVQCSLGWFKLNEAANYQHPDQTGSDFKDSQHVPEVVRSVASQLTVAHSPAAMRFSEINLVGDCEGQKFMRLEQSFAVNEAIADTTSLIVRLEFSWA